MFKLAAAASILLALTVSGARAEPVWQVGQDYVVHYQDLDLSTGQGRQALLTRIHHASQRICSGGLLTVDQLDCERSVERDAIAHSPTQIRIALQDAMQPHAPAQAMAAR